MLRFHASIRDEQATDALRVTFDEAFAALQAIDRLFIEPDGSFVWTGVAGDGQGWQVDGNLIDQGATLAYVEVSGSCPEAEFDRLLSVFCWPRVELTFYLPRRGVRLHEAEFRELAAANEGAI